MGARVLVFGATGQVGRELACADWGRGIEIMSLDRSAADLGDPDSVDASVRARRPDAVVIAAAYTAVDRAEDEGALAMRVNSVGPGAAAIAAASLGAPVVHLSTDYVFDGTKGEPYVEADPTRPLNVYGASKLAGEMSIRRGNPRHLILRTSWVYSAHGSNFLRTMLRLARERAEVKVVADQHGCPTSARDLAGGIVRLVSQALGNRFEKWGTYHLAGTAAVTWHGFAEAAFEELARRGLKRPRNVAIATDAYPTRARRPADTRLSCAAAERELGIRLPGYGQSLPAVLDEILAPLRRAAS